MAFVVESGEDIPAGTTETVASGTTRDFESGINLGGQLNLAGEAQTSAAETTIAAGTTQYGAPTNIEGQLNLAGQLNVDSTARVAAPGVGEGIGTVSDVALLQPFTRSNDFDVTYDDDVNVDVSVE